MILQHFSTQKHESVLDNSTVQKVNDRLMLWPSVLIIYPLTLRNQVFLSVLDSRRLHYPATVAMETKTVRFVTHYKTFIYYYIYYLLLSTGFITKMIKTFFSSLWREEREWR